MSWARFIAFYVYARACGWIELRQHGHDVGDSGSSSSSSIDEQTSSAVSIALKEIFLLRHHLSFRLCNVLYSRLHALLNMIDIH